MIRYQTELVFSLSDDGDQHSIPLILEFTVNLGHEPTLEQPGEGPSVSISKAHIGGAFHQLGAHEVPDWLWSFLEGDEAFQNELLDVAARDAEWARDQAVDARREERRLEAPK